MPYIYEDKLDWIPDLVLRHSKTETFIRFTSDTYYASSFFLSTPARTMLYAGGQRFTIKRKRQSRIPQR